ncbi:MAG TPA: 23S rRNA (pseudouridine(1915)-N(3))-methyltransferase RlmH [bacterium]|nr:23S rRNA (pseudouridine(1915)-N(3))-methyltransferase RlmH [bacterium]
MVFCHFVGPFKDKGLEKVTGRFIQRLELFWPVKVKEVPEKSKDLLKLVEGKAKKGILISLDPAGESMDSDKFTRWVTQTPNDLQIFAWGADGPPPEIRNLSMKKLSLSPMTYSHELARVLLMEQLYRAGAILKGHPYPH